MTEIEAHFILKTNFIEQRGFYKLYNPTYIMSHQESDALDYMCDEWDCCYVKEFPWDLC